MTYTKTYESGLRLAAYKMPDAYTVTFGIYVDVGSIKENEKNNGYSHFIEHLLFKGTKRFTAGQISEFADDIGAQLNAFTAKDNTCFYVKAVAGDLEKCVDLLSDMYFNSVFAEEEIEREKNVVIEEITWGEDMPEDVCQDLIAEAAFHGQAIGKNIVGKPENIKYSDRHSILEFKKQHYLPANTVISVAGKFDEDVLDKLIEKYFEANFDGTIQSEKIDDERARHTNEFLVRYKDSEQSHVALAFDGVSMNDEDCAVFSVASSVLGGGMSSRLFQTVREQSGLAYSVYSFPSLYKYCGYWEIYCGTNPENISKLCEILQRELAKFRDGGISEQELRRAKSQMINGIYMALESNMSVMTTIGRHLLKRNCALDFDKRIKQIESVTAEDVAALTQRLFEKGFASCYVGKKCPESALIAQIKL